MVLVKWAMGTKGALIAIVDDEESIRKALTRLLRVADFRTEAFGSASDFLDSLTAETPDCVILDLQMPGMTGVQLLQHFAEIRQGPPVIVVTAHDEVGSRDRCLALGAKRYFHKPIDREALLDSVAAVVAYAPAAKQVG